jgi:hypothetical protein
MWNFITKSLPATAGEEAHACRLMHVYLVFVLTIRLQTA